MKIYIPTTRARDNQKTATLLKAAGVDFVLVVNVSDSKAYDYWPHLLVKEKGIRAKRQWILEDAGSSKFVMMDDDLRFYFRWDDKKFIRIDESNSSEMKSLCDSLDFRLDTYAHGGIAEKFMSQIQPRSLKTNSKYYHVLAYNPGLFPVPPPKFRLELGQDHDFNLQLLTQGYPNFVLTEYCHDDKENAPGGCSEWRTEKLKRAEASRLSKNFPGLVTIRGTRPRINWKKAAQLGLENHPTRFPRQKCQEP